jgi:hypothetical protein
VIRQAAAVAVAIVLTAGGCSDEPVFGPYEAMVVHGPAGHSDEAPRLDVVTFRQAMNGRAQSCFGPRLADDPDSWSGTCLPPGGVPELDKAAFAHTEGSAGITLGLVTTDAAVVRARLRDDTTVEMSPYPHPDLEAGVFAFSIREGANIMTIEALDAAGQVLGSFDP